MAGTLKDKVLELRNIILGKADRAYVDSNNADLTNSINKKYTKPASGIPKTDLAPGVIPPEVTESTVSEWGFAKTEDIQDAYDDTELRNSIESVNNEVNKKYTKPVTGIPKTDLASDVIPSPVTEQDVSSWGFVKETDIPDPYDDSEIKSALSSQSKSIKNLEDDSKYTVHYEEGPDDPESDEYVLASEYSKKVEDLESKIAKESTEFAQETTKLKDDLSQLESTKVGYSEVVDGQLLMYSDDTKAHLLATLDLPSAGGVDDVQVNGTSVVTDGVANIPPANESVLGVLRAHPNYGVKSSTGRLEIVKATTANIDGRNGDYRPIVPSSVVYSVNSVICSTAETEQLTAEQQAAAQQRLGIGDYKLVMDFTIDVTDGTIYFDFPVGIHYEDFIVIADFMETEATKAAPRFGVIGKNRKHGVQNTSIVNSVSSRLHTYHMAKINDTMGECVALAGVGVMVNASGSSNGCVLYQFEKNNSGFDDYSEYHGFIFYAGGNMQGAKIEVYAR